MPPSYLKFLFISCDCRLSIKLIHTPVLRKASLTTPDLGTRKTNTAVFFSLIEDSPKLKEVKSNQINVVI